MTEYKICATRNNFSPVALLEYWKPVAGLEGWYEVSNVGNVRRSAPGFGTKINRMIKPQKNEGGYLRVYFCVAGKKLGRKSVHSLVAEAFIGPRPPGMEVNHKDLNTRNNWLSNLEYVTREANRLHAVETRKLLARKPKGNGGKPPVRPFKLTRAQVEYIWDQPRSVTNISLARMFSVSPSMLCEVRNKKCRVPED